MAGTGTRVVAVNRRARHEYFIEDTLEVGLVLMGSEVKALRAGHGSIKEAYAREQGGELYLFGCHISEFAPAARENHSPLRPRKLLLHREHLRGQSTRIGVVTRAVIAVGKKQAVGQSVLGRMGEAKMTLAQTQSRQHRAM